MKEQSYLTAEAIYRYLTGTDDQIDTLVCCKSSEVSLVTTDQSLYEALGSVDDKTQIDLHKLVKLLEVTKIKHFPEVMRSPRKILTDERVDEIRQKVEAK